MTSHQVQVLNCRLLRCLCDANLKQLRSSVKSQLLESLSESNWAFYVSFTHFRHTAVCTAKLQVSTDSSGDAEWLHCRGRPWGPELRIQQIPADSRLSSIQFHDVQLMFNWCSMCAAILVPSPDDSLSGYAVGKPEAWLEKLVKILRFSVGAHIQCEFSSANSDFVAWAWTWACSHCHSPRPHGFAQVSEWLLPVFVEHDRSSHAERMARGLSSTKWSFLLSKF